MVFNSVPAFILIYVDFCIEFANYVFFYIIAEMLIEVEVVIIHWTAEDHHV